MNADAAKKERRSVKVSMIFVDVLGAMRYVRPNMKMTEMGMKTKTRKMTLRMRMKRMKRENNCQSVLQTDLISMEILHGVVTWQAT